MKNKGEHELIAQTAFYIVVGILMCSPFTSSCQTTFNKTFGFQNHREEFASLVQIDSFYFFTGGSREEFSNNDSTKLVVVKTNLNGDILDSLNYQFDSLSNGGDYNSNNIILSDTGFFLSGSVINRYTNRQNGTIIYFKDFETLPRMNQYFLDSSEIFPSLFRMNNDFLIMGQSNSFGNNNYDYYLLKTDSLGSIKADSAFGGNNFEALGNGIKINDNHFVLCGRTFTEANPRIGWVVNAANAQFIAVDSNFNQIWNTVLYTPGTDNTPMIKDHGFFYYSIEYPVTPDVYREDFERMIGQIDLNNGNLLWIDTVKVEEEIIAQKFMETVDSTSFIVFTEVESPGIPYSYAKIIKYNNLGVMVWQRSYYEGNHNGCHLNTMIVDNDGYLVFGGTIANLETQSQDAWLLKLRPDGCLDDTDCGITTGLIDLTPGKSTFGVRVFPNPVSELAHITVEFTANYRNEHLDLQIYDMKGALIYTESQLLEGQIPMFNVDVSSFDKGTYLIQTCIQGKECGSGKLLVE